MGATLRVYHRAGGGATSRIRAIASSEQKGYPAGFAFDHRTTAWNSGGTGAKTVGQWIGADFGDGTPHAVTTVRIQWIYGAATPEAIRVEHSDNGRNWTTAGRFDVKAYPQSEPNFRVDEFRLSEPGKHRYWRIAADRNNQENGFGVAEVLFDGGATNDRN